MISTPLVVFYLLIAAGLWLGELDAKRAFIFLAVWGLGLVSYELFGLHRGLFVVIQVLLDIILILMIFGQDIRIR